MTALRRKVIRPPRGPFVFPGTKPGYDPGHIAASPRPRYSGVAHNGGFTNLLTGATGTPSTNNKPTFQVTSPIGHCLNFPSTGGDSAYSVTGDSSDILTFTMAAIVQIPSILGVSQTIFRNGIATSGNTGFIFDIGTTGLVRIAPLGGAALTSTIQLAVNVPYFVAASNGGAGNVCAMVGVNLLNGVTQTYSSTGATTDNAPSGGGFTIGNRYTPTGGANTWAGLIAAVSFTDKFMPLPALVQWGADPWSFWYPRK